MNRTEGKSRGKTGKFLIQMIEAGIARIPDKMKKYQRKPLNGRNPKGRRNYPWRKQKKT